MATEITVAEQQHAINPMQLMQLAIEREGSIDVIERLAKLQMQFTDREDRIAFRGAMTRFKDDMPKVIRSRAIKDKEGNEKYKAVALEDVAEPVMNALVKLGITYRYKTADLPDGRIRVTCILGMQGTAYEEEGSTLAAPPDTSGGKDALKAVGSTTSYLEKYTLMASVGMHVYGADPEATESPAKMKRDDISHHLEQIGNARNAEELRTLYLDAYKRATKIGDDAAVNQFIAAKDSRKAAL